LPAEDRNRTSPFPYGGHRFEFRAVGSSQNVSMVNTVLATICAASFKEFADQIEAGASPKEVASQALQDSWKTIFNGNGYDPAEQKRLTDLGLWRFDSGVDSICRLTVPKNVKLFQSMRVFEPEECEARQSIQLGHYMGLIDIEAKTMKEMIVQSIIPSIKNAGLTDVLPKLNECVKTIDNALKDIAETSDEIAQAHKCRSLRLETMMKIREVCDNAESNCPKEFWQLPTYKDLLFLDQTTA
jgi:glutamine synthetase